MSIDVASGVLFVLCSLSFISGVRIFVSKMTLKHFSRMVLNYSVVTKHQFKIKRFFDTKTCSFTSLKSAKQLVQLSHISQNEAINFDQELFNEYSFNVDQLMELAGLSVACSIAKSYSDPSYKNGQVFVVCGPGNNGGDGLVAARHLKLFGFNPLILYPKQGKTQLFQNLVNQCKKMDIEFINNLNELKWTDIKIVVDAVFGFSYKPPVRVEFYDILQAMAQLDPACHTLVCVDIPSGWHVEDGPPSDGRTPILSPDCLISLSAPKKCAVHFKGSFHWLGGRFVPPALAHKYNLQLPKYEGTEQCVLLK